MASREPAHRDWVKLYIKECLLGTIREDLSPEERGVWYDFLLLAGHSRVPGVICSNRTTPMSTRRISEILNAPEKLIEHCIEKFISSDRVKRNRRGCLCINNWNRYQYSDYDRQKTFRQKKAQEVEDISPEEYQKRYGKKQSDSP